MRLGVFLVFLLGTAVVSWAGDLPLDTVVVSGEEQAARSDNPTTCEDFCMANYRTCVGGCNNPEWSNNQIQRCNEGCI